MKFDEFYESQKIDLAISGMHHFFDEFTLCFPAISPHDVELFAAFYVEAFVKYPIEFEYEEERPDFIKDIKIVEVRVYDSPYDENKDVDVLVEYEGDASEDDVFNYFNKQEAKVLGVPFDFNPIKAEKSGTIEEYLKRLRSESEDKREDMASVF